MALSPHLGGTCSLTEQWKVPTYLTYRAYLPYIHTSGDLCVFSDWTLYPYRKVGGTTARYVALFKPAAHMIWGETCAPLVRHAPRIYA